MLLDCVVSDYVVMDVVLGLNVWDTEESLRSGLRDVCEIDYVKLIDLLPNSYCITIYHR